MAERAKSKPRGAAKGKVSSRGTVATLPKKGKKAGIGHNSGSVPDEVIKRHLDAMTNKRKLMAKVQEELDQARGVYRSARKLAKKEGVDLEAYDDMVKKHEGDHGHVITTAANTGRYLKLIESPLAQMELFQNLEVPAPAVDASLQGQAAGKNGEDRENNPFTAGTPDFVIWDEGWQLGQNMIAQTLGRGNDATQH